MPPPPPLYFIWTVEQPWPARLVWKQIALELIAMLVLGAIPGMLNRSPPTT